MVDDKALTGGVSSLDFNFLSDSENGADLLETTDPAIEGTLTLVPPSAFMTMNRKNLETIAVSKRSISLLPQKEVVRTDLQPFNQETQPLAKIWCVKMEEDTHQPDDLNSQMRVMKTYLMARYRLSDLLRAQRKDRMQAT